MKTKTAKRVKLPKPEEPTFPGEWVCLWWNDRLSFDEHWFMFHPTSKTRSGAIAQFRKAHGHKPCRMFWLPADGEA